MNNNWRYKIASRKIIIFSFLWLENDSALSCTRKKNLYSFEEYYKILSKKGLVMSKSNICFNVIFLIEGLNLRFADMFAE